MSEAELVVYENKWILQKIYEASDRIRHKIIDPTKFEERCIRRVGSYLTGDGSGVNNNKSYITRMIGEVAKSSISLYKKERSILISELIYEDDDGEQVEFQPIDVLADVESEIMANEITALLAQDGRRKVILEAWKLGNTNNKSISRTLVSTFGGNVETHRKFIQRFEKECQERLESVS